MVEEFQMASMNASRRIRGSIIWELSNMKKYNLETREIKRASSGCLEFIWRKES